MLPKSFISFVAKRQWHNEITSAVGAQALDEKDNQSKRRLFVGRL